MGGIDGIGGRSAGDDGLLGIGGENDEPPLGKRGPAGRVLGDGSARAGGAGGRTASGSSDIGAASGTLGRRCGMTGVAASSSSAA